LVEKASLVIKNGQIYTVDKSNPLAEALAVKSDKIVYMGSNEEVENQDIKGSIEVGKLADIIILTDNLFEIPIDQIKDVKVLLTIVGGKEVYRSEEF
jgi:predicted amidohydrolase YtcJ